MSKAHDDNADDVAPANVTPDDSDLDLELPQSPLPAGYYTEDGVPTFDAVRDRIERLSATADGNEVLDEESEKGHEFAQKREQLEQAGKDRLAQIRKSMGL